MARTSKKSFNVAAIGTDGGTVSTQLWQVDADEPLNVVSRWTQDPYKKLERNCPVVIAQHGGSTVFLTVGEALDAIKEGR